VVLAVDDSVDPSWVDGYRQLADRVLLVPYPGFFARTYAWLREQCSGRWILRVDSDEVPSPGLAAEVAETIAADDVTHAWIRRSWLFPDAETYLAQWPWRPDYQVRLHRNDPAVLRFPALMHEPIGAVGAHRYFRAPIYHADLLIHDLAERERKSAGNEAKRPGLVVDGTSINEAFYLPERRDDLRLASVPPEDAAAIAAYLDPQPPTGPPRGSVERFGLDDLTRVSEHRSLSDADYRAQVKLLDDDHRVVAGERRAFDVEVTNLGTTHWPGAVDPHPQIRLGYRWIGADGERIEGGRTPIGSVVRPGESVIVALAVLGPSEPGLHEIEIDLVHELVRWFDCAVRAQIEVRRPAGGRVEQSSSSPGS
jgi:hypothetical protein